jgi:hypothetical protein
MFGDSNVEHYSPRAIYLNHSGAANTIYWGARGGCLPIPHVFQDADHFCPQVKSATIRLLQRNDVKKVVIGACWACYFNEIDKPDSKFNYYFKDGNRKIGLNTEIGRDLAFAELENLLRELKNTKDVYLLLGSPLSHEANPRLFLNKNRLASALPLIPENYLIHLSPAEIYLRKKLTDIAHKTGAKIIDPTKHFCKDSICKGLTDDGRFLYKDNSHLRPFYVRNYASYIDISMVAR